MYLFPQDPCPVSQPVAWTNFDDHNTKLYMKLYKHDIYVSFRLPPKFAPKLYHHKTFVMCDLSVTLTYSLSLVSYLFRLHPLKVAGGNV